MAVTVVGQVISLHRYPVKSMAGEDLAAAHVGVTGLSGDRGYALIDQETGHVISAKRPRRWPGLLGYRARFAETPDGAAELPPVVITCPDGTTVSSLSGSELDATLSTRFGRAVRLASTPPGGARLEYQWPDQPNLWYQGRLYRDELTEHVIHPGTFFDSGILHLVTTASLTELRSRASGSDFDPRRFRANLVVDTLGRGFVENDWVGRVVRIGDTVISRIVKPCIRCVMVNLEQPGVAADGGVLAAAFGHNAGNVGVKGDVLSTGTIRLGDPVVIE